MESGWIIRETSHWLALNKPPGMVVESNRYGNDAAEDVVRRYLSTQYRNPYVGIVHRLDRPTSGLLLLAKRKSALRSLNEQFQRRKIRKTYLAWVHDGPENDRGVLENWLIKDLPSRRARIVEKQQKRAVIAKLAYERLEQKAGQTLLKIVPNTGRFHQIRAQLAHHGCPIIGDVKYGSEIELPANSIGLHASRLHFTDPKSGIEMDLVAENIWWSDFSVGEA